MKFSKKNVNLSVGRLSEKKSQEWLNLTNDAFSSKEFITMNLSLPLSITQQSVYGVLLKHNASVWGYPENSILIFNKGSTDKANLGRLHCAGIWNRLPVIVKLISNSSLEKPQSSARLSIPRRKSFMTPTPLHIPSSKVSPIPSSSHAMTILQPTNPKQKLIAILSKDLLWLHPLIHVHSP